MTFDSISSRPAF